MKLFSFGSDNHSGIHPQVLESIAQANKDHCHAYGEDPHTFLAIEKFKNHFGDDIAVEFMLTGTGANVTALQSLSQSFESIFCTDISHLHMDECGAPEKHTGSKLITIPHVKGKLTIENLQPHIYGFGFVHHSQPKLISITQTTEYGTLYTVDEIRQICDFAHKNGMLVHMDGARISNAAVSLGVDFRAFTFDVGIDVLSFGGTKNGLMIGEAVLFRKASLLGNFPYFRKQNMQLASKMRFIAAQFSAFFESNLWYRNAKNANDLALNFADKLMDFDQIQLTYPVQSNAIFAIMPKDWIAELQKRYHFYTWNEFTNEVRLMCSFDTQQSQIDGFIQNLKELENKKAM